MVTKLKIGYECDHCRIYYPEERTAERCEEIHKNDDDNARK